MVFESELFWIVKHLVPLPVPFATILRLSNFMWLAPFKRITDLFEKDPAVLISSPFPLIVIVLTALVLIESARLLVEKVTCSLYGPDPATTSTTTGPDTPRALIESERSLNDAKLVPPEVEFEFTV